MVMTGTSTVTAKILAVDAEKSSVTLQTADGKKKKIKVHRQVEGLDQLSVGDDVTIVWTEALAIDVSAP